MNVWKISTVGLAMALALVVGKGSFSSANASPAPSETDRVSYDWAKEQPNMERALVDINGARKSLKNAADNKGGWRALALKHVDEAEFETKRGMEYAKNHPHDE